MVQVHSKVSFCSRGGIGCIIFKSCTSFRIQLFPRKHKNSERKTCQIFVRQSWFSGRSNSVVRLDSGRVQGLSDVLLLLPPPILYHSPWSGEGAIRCSRATNAPLSDLEPAHLTHPNLSIYHVPQPVAAWYANTGHPHVICPTWPPRR